MKKSSILYIASQSKSRHDLLRAMGVDFRVLTHASSEEETDMTLPFAEYVMAIATHKMDNVMLPSLQEVRQPSLFVLTADTLIRTMGSHEVLGKPKDYNDARRMIRLLREEGVEVMTGCCVRKYQQQANGWKLEAERLWSTGAYVEYIIDEALVDWYFQKMPHALQVCAGCMIEAVGQLFLKRIDGSYSATLGLPLFELRQELIDLDFEF